MIDFLGIGAQKAATTWLFKNLSTHAQVRFPAGKEVHFWDNSHRLKLSGVDHWLSLFPPVAEPIKQGEITPAYGMLDINTIRQIFAMAPQLRLFYSIRNPIERSWSSAQMALRRAEMIASEASDQWFIDHFLSRGSRLRSDYLGTIERWTAVFPEEALQVIFFDDILTHPKRVLTKLSQHIGIDPAFWLSQPDGVFRKVIRPPGTAQAPPSLTRIRSSLKLFLIGLYQKDIEKMASYFQRDFSHWLT
ncbi:MAG: sulfotransferase domain-containing protein [Cyanobacteria bacterium P01_D01_bin.44]